MKNKLAIILILVAGCLQAQNLKPDESDLYIQHMVMHKGDKFQFNNLNTTPRNKCGTYDKKIWGKPWPKSLKISFDQMENNVQAFWLRHPMTVQPYTEYVFRYKTFIKKAPQNLPELEFAVYEQSRETQVESHVFQIKEGKGWQEGIVRFKTENQAQFARIRVNVKKSDMPCEIYFNGMELEQISEPKAFMPEPTSVFSLNDYMLSDDKPIMENAEKLPASDFYSITTDISWIDPNSECRLVFEWLDDSLKNIGSEVCNVSPSKGVLPDWDGVELEWRKNDETEMGWISRQKDRFYNEDGKRGISVYKTYKPKGAKYIRIIKEGDLKGSINNLSVVGEY